MPRSARPISRWISTVRPSSAPAGRVARLPLRRRRRQHPVLRRHPARAAPAHPAGHGLLDRRGADDARAALGDEHGALGGADEVDLEATPAGARPAGARQDASCLQAVPGSGAGGALSARPSSSSCGRSTGVGASVSGSMPPATFGKAITSRMLSVPASEHDAAVEPHRDAAVRRGAEAQRPQQEAEARLGLLGGDADHRQRPLLQVGAVDADRAAAGLVAVDDEVVGLRQHRAGIGLQQRLVLRPRRREDVVLGHPALLVRVEVVGREVDDPGERPGALGDQLEALRQVRPQRAEHALHHRPLVGGEEDRVALRRRPSPRAGRRAPPRRGTWRSASAPRRTPPAAGTRAPCRPTPWRRRPARRARAAPGRAPPGHASARTTPPPSAAPRKTLNSEPRTSSVTSAISRPKRRSGRSEP